MRHSAETPDVPDDVTGSRPDSAAPGVVVPVLHMEKPAVAGGSILTQLLKGLLVNVFDG